MPRSDYERNDDNRGRDRERSRDHEDRHEREDRYPLRRGHDTGSRPGNNRDESDSDRGGKKSKRDKVKLVTPVFRGSFVNLAKPKRVEKENGDEKDEWSLLIAIPKDDPEVDDFLDNYRRMMQDASAEVHGGDGLTEDECKYPWVKDGDDKDWEDYDNLHGCWLINAKSNFEVDCMDRRGNKLYEGADLYSGAYYRATISPYPWKWGKTGKSRGVSTNLESVLKWKDGEKLGGGSSAKADFNKYIDKNHKEERGERGGRGRDGDREERGGRDRDDDRGERGRSHRDRDREERGGRDDDREERSDRRGRDDDREERGSRRSRDD
jgi:hypothetical protein